MIDDLDEDVIFIKNAISKIPDHSRVTEFIPGPGIHKLKLNLISINLGIVFTN